MSLSPLLSAPWFVQVHAFAAMAALGLGAGQLLLAKGTQSHRFVGYIWVALMMLIALSSFFINDIRLVGPFGPIHLLSLLTLYSGVVGVIHARAGRVRAHQLNMQILFWSALVGAGLFTLLPSRIMGQVVFGG